MDVDLLRRGGLSFYEGTTDGIDRELMECSKKVCVCGWELRNSIFW